MMNAGVSKFGRPLKPSLKATESNQVYLMRKKIAEQEKQILELEVTQMEAEISKMERELSKTAEQHLSSNRSTPRQKLNFASSTPLDAPTGQVNADNDMRKEKPTVSRGSKLERLDPFLDEDGLIRVGGRVEEPTMRIAPVGYSYKYIYEAFIGKKMFRRRFMAVKRF